jgi:membrane protease YdiL (CAAX protease family)
LIVLLLLTTLGAACISFLADVATAPLVVWLIAIPIEVVHGTGEEVLWRGLYVASCPGQPLLAILYPTLGFALWHLSPQLVFPCEGGILAFIGLVGTLGLVYGVVAYRTRSLRWVALSHALNGILALGQPISSCLLRLWS